MCRPITSSGNQPSSDSNAEFTQVTLPREFAVAMSVGVNSKNLEPSGSFERTVVACRADRELPREVMP